MKHLPHRLLCCLLLLASCVAGSLSQGDPDWLRKLSEKWAKYSRASPFYEPGTPEGLRERFRTGRWTPAWPHTLAFDALRREDLDDEDQRIHVCRECMAETLAAFAAVTVKEKGGRLKQISNPEIRSRARVPKESGSDKQSYREREYLSWETYDTVPAQRLSANNLGIYCNDLMSMTEIRCRWTDFEPDIWPRYDPQRLIHIQQGTNEKTDRLISSSSSSSSSSLSAKSQEEEESSPQTKFNAMSTLIANRLQHPQKMVQGTWNAVVDGIARSAPPPPPAAAAAGHGGGRFRFRYVVN